MLWTNTHWQKTMAGTPNSNAVGLAPCPGEVSRASKPAIRPPGGTVLGPASGPHLIEQMDRKEQMVSNVDLAEEEGAAAVCSGIVTIRGRRAGR